MSVSSCPDCDRPLYNKPSCACGWSAPVIEDEFKDPFDAVNVPPAAPYVSAPVRVVAAGDSYRERWFRNEKQEYFPPKLDACPPFQCIGYKK